jgi:hypothetical protein
LTEPAGLAGIPPQDQPWEDLLDGRAPREPGETAAGVKRSLGIGPGYERPRPASLPDVSDLRSRLDL